MTYLILLVFVVAFVAYYVLVVPKMKQKGMENVQVLKDSLKGHEEEKKVFYLNDEETLKPIMEALKGQSIEAIVSCRQKKNIKDFAKEKAIGAAGELGKELMGIQFKEKDNQETCFLVLTSQALHYLFFKEGELKQKEDYLFSKIKNAKWGEGGMTDVIQGGSKNDKKFAFEYDGENIALFYLPSISFWPSGDMVNSYEPAVLFSENFDENLKKMLGLS